MWAPGRAAWGSHRNASFIVFSRNQSDIYTALGVTVGVNYPV